MNKPVDGKSAGLSYRDAGVDIEAGDAVSRLMSPAARQSLGASEIERLTEAVGSSLHVVYVIAGLVALISLVLAMALPARLSPTRPHRRA